MSYVEWPGDHARRIVALRNTELRRDQVTMLPEWGHSNQSHRDEPGCSGYIPVESARNGMRVFGFSDPALRGALVLAWN